jgi:hypothetical protein
MRLVRQTENLLRICPVLLRLHRRLAAALDGRGRAFSSGGNHRTAFGSLSARQDWCPKYPAEPEEPGRALQYIIAA